MKYSNDLDFLFHPATIAISGVSEDIKKFNAGYKFMDALMKIGFKGKIYPMNPGGGEINGMKIYTSLKDIPDKVDYVISAIPARYTPQLVEDSIAKGVKAIHFFTSGFSEIENVEGKRLQSEIINKARDGGVRIIGPNCLGICCPSGGLSFSPDLSTINGNVGMISQSGGNAAHCVQEGIDRNVFFSKVVSMGNGADLNESDYLEYLIQDNETKIIVGYIEGVREGRRFFKALKVASSEKPTILFKVGTSESGARAAISHTTALAGSDQVWDGLFKQAGVIRAVSIEEIIDVTVALQRMKVPKGNRVIIAGIGGGASVILADEFSNVGLAVPMLSDSLRKRIIDLYPSEAGRIFKNPIDFNDFETSDSFIKTIKVLDEYEGADLLVLHFAFDHFGLISIKDKEAMISFYLQLIQQVKGEITKPLAIILHSYASDSTRKIAYNAMKELNQSGLAVYPSIRRGAVAISKFVRYHQQKKRPS